MNSLSAFILQCVNVLLGQTCIASGFTYKLEQFQGYILLSIRRAMQHISIAVLSGSPFPSCTLTAVRHPALISKDFILWSVDGHLFRQYKMTTGKVKIMFYGRWGSGLSVSGKREVWSSPVGTEELHGNRWHGATRFGLSPGYFPPKNFLCTICCITFMCYDCLEGCKLNLNEFLSKRHCENKCNFASLLFSPPPGSPHPPRIRAIT